MERCALTLKPTVHHPMQKFLSRWFSNMRNRKYFAAKMEGIDLSMSPCWSLMSSGKAKKGEAFSKDVSLKLDPSNSAYRLIAFVQEANQGKILGAAVERVQK